jgi:hypothetical protein
MIDKAGCDPHLNERFAYYVCIHARRTPSREALPIGDMTTR